MSRPNAQGLPEYLRKDAGGFFIDYYLKLDGKRKRRRVRLGHIPLVQAKLILAKHLMSIMEKRFLAPEKPKVTLGQAADSYIAYAQARKKSFLRDELNATHLIEFFGREQILDDLTLDRVEEYVVFRRKQRSAVGRDLKGATLNREITWLKSIIRRMIHNQLMDRNPLEGVKPFKETARSRTLTPEEYERLVNACTGYLQPLVRMAYVTAMRRGELLRLRWDQVDYQERVIVLEAEDTKTQERREIPLDGGLFEILRGIPRVLGCPYVFTYRGKSVVETKTSFHNVCKRAGIKDFKFHDLRHCAITNMRKAGIPDNVIMSISGHKTAEMFRRYDRVDRMDRREALVKLRELDTNKTFRTLAGSEIQTA